MRIRFEITVGTDMSSSIYSLKFKTLVEIQICTFSPWIEFEICTTQMLEIEFLLNTKEYQQIHRFVCIEKREQ